jgi:uncharacterized membrane protein YGL010W
MRNIHDWFDAYGADHQHPTNRAIHWVCVPVILWCVVAALWLVPVPPAFLKPGAWSVLAMFLAYLFYARLSRRIGTAMAGVFIVLALITAGLHHWLGPARLAWVAGTLFVAAWIGQFIGHAIEGRRPSFLTDLAYLLIGPAWLMGKALRRLGVAY